MNPDEFENILSRQPLRRAPAEWREEILAAARPSSFGSRPSRLSTLRAQLSAILWPHPKAWAGLAAIWVLTIALQYDARDPAQARPEPLRATPLQIAAVLRSQKELLTDLLSDHRTTEADKAKSGEGQPRSETRNRIFMG